MEIGYVVSELWRLRTWVAVGALIAVLASMSVLYKLPSFEAKSFELGAASTEVVVEPPGSPLGLLGIDPQAVSLVTQAGLYASLLNSPPVKLLIGKASGIQPGLIATTGQPTGQGDQTGREVASEQRGSELLAEANSYRILSFTREDIPLISIYTQAPTADEAIRLANGAVKGLDDYVTGVASQERVEGSLRLRQLGSATGGTITQNASLKVAILAFVGALGGWCLLILVVARVRAGWHEARTAEQQTADDSVEARRPSARGDVAA